jgi:hypothetical protein
MAGLGTTKQQQQPAAGQQMAQPAGGDDFESPAGMLGDFDEDAMEQASPEEQAQYEQFVNSGLAMIYPEQSPGEVNPAILSSLRGQFEPDALAMFEDAQPALTDSPQDSVAATAVLLTVMNEGRGEFTDDVVMHGGAALIEELVEVAEAAKIHEFSDKEMEGITYRAMDLYRISSPRADPAALTEEFKQLMAANEQGTLNKVLPGLPGGPAMTQQQGAA